MGLLTLASARLPVLLPPDLIFTFSSVFTMGLEEVEEALALAPPADMLPPAPDIELPPAELPLLPPPTEAPPAEAPLIDPPPPTLEPPDFEPPPKECPLAPPPPLVLPAPSDLAFLTFSDLDDFRCDIFDLLFIFSLLDFPDLLLLDF